MGWATAVSTSPSSGQRQLVTKDSDMNTVHCMQGNLSRNALKMTGLTCGTLRDPEHALNEDEQNESNETYKAPSAPHAVYDNTSHLRKLWCEGKDYNTTRQGQAAQRE